MCSLSGSVCSGCLLQFQVRHFFPVDIVFPPSFLFRVVCVCIVECCSVCECVEGGRVVGREEKGDWNCLGRGWRSTGEVCFSVCIFERVNMR